MRRTRLSTARTSRPVRAAAALGLGVALTVATAVPASAAAAAPWRQGDYGPARSSFNPNETLVNASSIAKVAFARSVTAPPTDPQSEGCGGGVATQPVVVDHRMFVVLTGTLESIDLTNGHVLWSRALDTSLATFYTGLAVVSGRVVLASLDCISQSDPSGSVTAFNAATGAQQWNQFFDPGPEWMTVLGGQALFTGFEAGGGGDLVSVAVADGTVQWQYAPGFCDGMGRPIVVHGVVVVEGCNAGSAPRLEGHSLSTGAVLWSRPGDFDVQRGDSATSGGHDAYVVNRGTGALLDVNPLTGSTRWSRTGVGDALAVDAARVYTDCGPDTLCAWKRSNGTLAWQHTENQVSGSPVAVAGGVVLAGGGGDAVLRASTGAAVQDQFGDDLVIWSDPQDVIAVANGRVVVAGARIVDVYAVPGV